MARILLLGSTGFFGRGVAHKLIDAGHQLRVLVRDPMKAAGFKIRGAQVMVGDALVFENDRLLARTVILQNQWATEAVFKMLDDEAVKGHLGRFTASDCALPRTGE